MKEVDITTITTENSYRDGRPGFLRRRFGLIGSVLVLLLIAWAAWSWGFCRFYVGPGNMAVIVSKVGAEPPADRILAQPGEKGILEDVLGEGRHIWNPLFYDWEIHAAQYIPPGKVGIVTALSGAPLPEGEVLAGPGQKGTRRAALGPGLYRLNPYGYSVEIVDAISIPIGFVGVVTNQTGKPVPREALAGPGEQGTRPDILQPGIYYNNPRQYKVEAIEVGVNQISLQGQAGTVILSKSVAMDENNQMIQRLNQNVLAEQQRRRQERLQDDADFASAPTQAGAIEDFLAAPGATASRAMGRRSPVAPAAGRTRSIPGQQAMAMEKDVPPEFILNQFVNFPSRDGFDISLDMTVEFELLPENIAMIRCVYEDLPGVVDKALMPQVLSISRNTGSTYRAVDFIAGEGREKFQNDLTDALQSSVREKNLMVHSALISNVNVPRQILEPLQAASLSRETDLTNKEKQNTARKQADLNREMSLIKQFGEQVMQETTKMKAQIDAEREKTVAMIRADTQRQMAAIDKETAAVRASRTVVIGEAEASALRMVEAERASGFGMKVEAFGSDSENYALYEFARNLNPELKISLIHAGAGTLWTDLRGATIGDLGVAKLLNQ